MTDTLPLLGYLPEFYGVRREMLALVHRMWRWYAALIVFMWVVLPWRIGWQGAGLCVWSTFWCAYARFWGWWADQRVRSS